MGALQKTKNLLRLYRYSRGLDETPEIFHTWACLSMMAACVGNRVWLWRTKDQPLFPNLYVVLVADSGVGKERAISPVENLVRGIPLVNFQRFKTTGPSLIDLLGKAKVDPHTGQKVIESSKIFLVHPEVKLYLGKGEHAQTLIELLTELYGGNVSFSEGTRTSGLVQVRQACINWLAGSTPEWLVQAVTPDAIRSGFFGRTVVVKGLDEVVKYEPTYPEDYDEVMAHIQARVYALTATGGEMRLDDEAKNWLRGWYENPIYNPKPEDELLLPTWKRQRELILKLGMLLCLATGDGMVIRQCHVTEAWAASQAALLGLPSLGQFSEKTPRMGYEDKVAKWVKRSGEIDRSTLTKRLHNERMDAKACQLGVSGLISKGLIEYCKTPTGKTIYIWRGE